MSEDAKSCVELKKVVWQQSNTKKLKRYLKISIQGLAVDFLPQNLWGGETGSKYVQSQEVRWYVHWQPLNLMNLCIK